MKFEKYNREGSLLEEHSIHQLDRPSLLKSWTRKVHEVWEKEHWDRGKAHVMWEMQESILLYREVLERWS